MGRLDFKKIAAAALSSIDSLLGAWLPDGKRHDNEYKARNPTRQDNKVGSFSINLNTGHWADFADASADAKGGDLISLFGYLNHLPPLEAAKEVAAQLGISLPESDVKNWQKPAPAQAGKGGGMLSATPPKKEAKEPNWVPILPVPATAPPVPLAHIKRGKPERTWAYKDTDGQLLGYIWRFTTSTGGKEIVPFTFCRHSVTGAHEWRNVQFAEPRPLYVPGEGMGIGGTKLIVEGEKCADAAHARLGERFNVVTWPGGGKAIDKADWSRFEEGDKVIIWPDCDAQREKLTKERELAGFDAAAMPLLPEDKQPGMVTAEKIAEKLMARGCIVRIVKIPSPGEKPSGWDVADAIEDGWTNEQLQAFILDNLRKPSTADDQPAPRMHHESIYPASEADAGGVGWSDSCFWKDGKLRECRENVFQILQLHPEWKDCLALDEFSNSIKVRRDTPTGLKKDESWDEDQDFKLAFWLAEHLRLFIKSDSMIASGVRATAVDKKYHPVREWLDGLQWDGKERLKSWLTDYAGVAQSEYVEIVGRLFLIGMVARIYRPGCKMDTALIMEGLQGEGKSSIAKALTGKWFGETPFVMGDKDSFLGLRGKWAYELAELDSFNRSESTRAKAFISSGTDTYRAPYDRVTKDHPRQCVFIGTTNQYEYFKDSSGNRRYWPVLCSGALHVHALMVMREQLFAEAVTLYNQGENWWPTKEQQDRLFTPEQEAREIMDPWEIAIYQWTKDVCTSNKLTSLDVLVGALKMEVAKIDGAKQATTRVGVIMHKLGWMKRRESSGKREYYYERPKVVSEKPEVSDEPHPF